MPVAGLSLAWTAWLLADAWPALQRNLPLVHWPWLGGTLLLNVLSSYLAFEAFQVLFKRVQPTSYGRAQLAHLYFAGQLMKHLPGRVWGLAYQAAQGRRASLAQWVAVTTVYMLLGMVLALWIAAAVLGFMRGWAQGLVVTLIGLLAYGLGWQSRPLNALLSLSRRAPWPLVHRLGDALRPFADADAALKLQVLLWFVVSWMVYLLAWAGYGMAWPSLEAVDGVWLCAFYTLAWFVGYVSLVTPSGVGIRELVFVLLAHRFPPDVVAGTAVLGRVMLLCVDLVLGALFLPFGDAADDPTP